MKKTYKEFQEQVLEKTLSPQDIDDLIDKSIEGVTAIKNDKKRNKEDVSTAKSVLKWLQGVRATFEKEGSLHPSNVLFIMKTVAGVSSRRYGYMVPGWKYSPQGKVPKDFSNEELNEGMTSSVARMSAILLKKKVVGFGNRLESEKGVRPVDILLAKMITGVAGIALVACSLSGEGLLSKGAIFTSLFSSNEPDENLDALFEDEI